MAVKKAAAKAQTPPALKKTEPAKPAVEETKEVVQAEAQVPEVITKEASECHDRIIQLQANIQNEFWDLSGELVKAEEFHYYRQWGYETLEAFANKELETGYRKMRYLIDIRRTADEFGIPRERIVGIGWTKMKEITGPIRDAEGAEDKKEALLKLAEENAMPELSKALKVVKGTPATADVMKLALRFTAETGKVVSDAITVAQAEIGKKDNNDAIGHICSEFVMGRAQGGTAATLEDHLAYISERFNVDLEYTEREAQDVNDALGLDEGETASKGGTDEIDDLLGLSEE